eukprot:gene16693-19844_t
MRSSIKLLALLLVALLFTATVMAQTADAGTTTDTPTSSTAGTTDQGTTTTDSSTSASSSTAGTSAETTTDTPTSSTAATTDQGTTTTDSSTSAASSTTGDSTSTPVTGDSTSPSSGAGVTTDVPSTATTGASSTTGENPTTTTTGTPTTDVLSTTTTTGASSTTGESPSPNPTTPTPNPTTPTPSPTPSVVLPKIPESFSSIVAYSDYVGGYTMTFKEYYNAQLNLSRVDSSNTTISNFATNTSYTWQIHGVKACQSNNFIPEYLPTTRSLYAKLNTVQLNTTTIDRQIECEVYSTPNEVTVNSTFVDTITLQKVNVTKVTELFPECVVPTKEGDVVSAVCTFTKDQTGSCSYTSGTDAPKVCPIGKLTDLSKLNTTTTDPTLTTSTNKTDSITYSFTELLYFNKKTLEPVRMSAQGQSVDEGVVKALNFQIDWVNWEASPDEPWTQVFAYNATECPLSTKPSYTLPETKTILPHADQLDITKIQSTFTGVFEEIISGGSTNSFVWRNDPLNKTQTIEVDNPVGGDTVSIFNDDNTGYSINTFTLVCDKSNLVNPLMESHKNILVKILAESTATSFTNWTYITTTPRRSVDTDVWAANTTVDKVTYKVKLYLAAAGWTFPGRFGVDNTTIIPIAIESEYYFDGVFNGTDKWDIWMFTPDTIPDSFVNPLIRGCYPTIPASYNAQVSLTYGDSGSTFVFQESSVQTDTQKQYASVGKFNTPTDRLVVDYSTNKISYKSPTYCNATKLNSTSILQSNFGPSTNFFTRTPFMGATTFLGTVPVRGINALAWTTSSSGATFTSADNKTFTETAQFTSYWKLLADNTTYVPLRLDSTFQQVEVANATNQRTYGIFVEWITFTAGPQDIANFTLKDCETVEDEKYFIDNVLPTINTNLLPNRTFTAPPLSNSVKPPANPDNFSAYLELTITINNNSTTANETLTKKSLKVNWQVDHKHNAELVQSTAQDGTQKTYLFCYMRQGFSGSAYYSTNGAMLSLAPTPRLLNPLSTLGDTKLVELFYGSALNNAKLAATYSTHRGASAEQWVITNGVNSTSVLYYPTGWMFNNATSTARAPMTVTHIDSTATTQTTENWEFYQYNVASDVNTWAAPCANVSQGRGGWKDTGLSAGVISAIVIVVSFVTIGIAFITFMVLRKRGIIGRKVAGHILLDERNPNQMNQHLRDHVDAEDGMQREEF